jgi:hypothetical protein
MGASAEVMQAVPTMLELVPSGVNKWVALQQALLPSLGLSPEQVLAYFCSPCREETVQVHSQHAALAFSCPG